MSDLEQVRRGTTRPSKITRRLRLTKKVKPITEKTTISESPIIVLHQMDRENSICIENSSMIIPEIPFANKITSPSRLIGRKVYRSEDVNKENSPCSYTSKSNIVENEQTVKSATVDSALSFSAIAKDVKKIRRLGEHCLIVESPGSNTTNRLHSNLSNEGTPNFFNNLNVNNQLNNFIKSNSHESSTNEHTIPPTNLSPEHSFNRSPNFTAFAKMSQQQCQNSYNNSSSSPTHSSPIKNNNSLTSSGIENIRNLRQTINCSSPVSPQVNHHSNALTAGITNISRSNTTNTSFKAMDKMISPMNRTSSKDGQFTGIKNISKIAPTLVSDSTPAMLTPRSAVMTPMTNLRHQIQQKGGNINDQILSHDEAKAMLENLSYSLNNVRNDKAPMYISFFDKYNQMLEDKSEIHIKNLLHMINFHERIIHSSRYGTPREMSSRCLSSPMNFSDFLKHNLNQSIKPITPVSYYNNPTFTSMSQSIDPNFSRNNFSQVSGLGNFHLDCLSPTSNFYLILGYNMNLFKVDHSPLNQYNFGGYQSACTWSGNPLLIGMGSSSPLNPFPTRPKNQNITSLIKDYSYKSKIQ